MIILNKYPPEVYGNLKALCDDLKTNYSIYGKNKPYYLLHGK